MLIIARILTGLLALIALGTGAKSALGGLSELPEVPQVLDNTYRYYAGVWAGVGAGLAYCAVAMPEVTVLLRCLMLAIFLGGLARAVGMTAYDAVETKVMVGTGIEVIAPILVIGLTALSQGGN